MLYVSRFYRLCQCVEYQFWVTLLFSSDYVYFMLYLYYMDIEI